jgi:hypothetical protein
MVLLDLVLRFALPRRALALPSTSFRGPVGVVVFRVVGSPLAVHSALKASECLCLAVEIAAEVGGDHLARGNNGNMGWTKVHPDHARTYWMPYFAVFIDFGPKNAVHHKLRIDALATPDRPR